MIKTEYILRNEILLYDGVRDRELLLTCTLNILNNYFIAILATDIVSFAFYTIAYWRTILICREH
jgi:hypothetical protein